MGGGLPGLVIVVVVVLIVVLASVYVVVPWVRRQERERKEITDPRRESLVYEVPEGHDPAVIVTALRNDGLEATEVLRQGRQRVVIACPERREDLRPRARAVIAHEARLNFEGDPATQREVTFLDE
jgi:heme/copper-type cytochrome/quinol oxidase subunit 2